MAHLFNQSPSLWGVVKRRIIHSKDEVGWEFLQEMIVQSGVKPLGIGPPLEQHGDEKPR